MQMTEPTRDQLLAMAYLDGELAESVRREFQLRLRREPGLMRAMHEQEVVLMLMNQVFVAARPVATPESPRPQDASLTLTNTQQP